MAKFLNIQDFSDGEISAVQEVQTELLNQQSNVDKNHVPSEATIQAALLDAIRKVKGMDIIIENPDSLCKEISEKIKQLKAAQRILKVSAKMWNL